MAYVSAMYAPPNPAGPVLEEGKKQVIAIDDQGRECWLTEDSQQGDWLAYLDAGGTIEPVAVPVDANITAVPDTLFGGKTIREALSGQ